MGHESSHSSRPRLGILGLVFTIFAVAQRLAGYENKPLAVILAAVAVVLLLYACISWIRDFWKRRTTEPTTSTAHQKSPAAEKVVAKQTVEGDHNASYAITGAGNMLVVGSPVSRSVLAPSQARSQKSSYLVYRGIVPEDLLISTWSTTGFTDHECVDAFRAKALLARFENERRGESPSRTGAVIAKLTFHLVSGATRSIDYGVWLNSQFRSVNIGLGETERLVVLIDLGDSLFAVADRRDGGTPFPANDYYQRYPLAPGISSVDIRLVDPPHGTYSISLDVSRDDNGLFSVSARDERRI